jgi:hypothetical protein
VTIDERSEEDMDVPYGVNALAAFTVVALVTWFIIVTYD